MFRIRIVSKTIEDVSRSRESTGIFFSFFFFGCAVKRRQIRLNAAIGLGRRGRERRRERERRKRQEGCAYRRACIEGEKGGRGRNGTERGLGRVQAVASRAGKAREKRLGEKDGERDGHG